MNRQAPPARALCLTLSLLANVRLLRDWLLAVDDFMEGRGPRVLDAENPMGDLIEAGTKLEEVSAALRKLGYRPPEIDVALDPVGFIRGNAEFLTKVEPWLVSPVPINEALQ